MITRLLLISAAVALPAAPLPAQGQKPVNRADYLKTVDGRFNAIDANHDGTITKEELGAELQREMQQASSRIQQQLQAKFRQLDTNKDGQLSMKEFMAAQPSLHANQTPEQMLQGLDANHDGKLTADEFRAPEVAKFNRVDANHDGTVTPEEIRRASGQK